MALRTSLLFNRPVRLGRTTNRSRSPARGVLRSAATSKVRGISPSVAGGSLTATHIIQSALVIGGSAGNPAVVTIAASDASGDPLAADAMSGVATPGISTVPAASYTSGADVVIAGGVSSTGGSPLSFAGNLSRDSSLPGLSSSDRSREAVASHATADGIDSTELTPPGDISSGGGRSLLSDSSTIDRLAPIEFVSSNQRTRLETVLAADFETSDFFHPQWLGTDLPPQADTSAALEHRRQSV